MRKQHTKIKVSLLLSFFLVLFTTSPVHARKKNGGTYIKSEIWFVGWNVKSRFPWDINNAKQARQIYLEVNDYSHIRDLRDSIKVDTFTCSRKSTFVNVRLVTTFETRDGKKQTFIADDKTICSEDQLCCRSIDKQFRERFNFLNRKNPIE